MALYVHRVWNPEHEWHTASVRKAFNRRVKPRAKNGKWVAFYCKGPKSGKQMATFDSQAEAVVFIHKSSKILNGLKIINEKSTKEVQEKV